MAVVGSSSHSVMENRIRGEIKANLHYWFSPTVQCRQRGPEELSSAPVILIIMLMMVRERAVWSHGQSATSVQYSRVCACDSCILPLLIFTVLCWTETQSERERDSILMD